MAGSGIRVAVADTQVAGSGIRSAVDTQVAGIHTPVEGHSQVQEEGRRAGVPGVAETE